MTNRGRRILYSREEYFRALLPDAKDEKTRQAILAIIEDEQGRPVSRVKLEGTAKDPGKERKQR